MGSESTRLPSGLAHSLAQSAWAAPGQASGHLAERPDPPRPAGLAPLQLRNGRLQQCLHHGSPGRAQSGHRGGHTRASNFPAAARAQVHGLGCPRALPILSRGLLGALSKPARARTHRQGALHQQSRGHSRQQPPTRERGGARVSGAHGAKSPLCPRGSLAGGVAHLGGAVRGAAPRSMVPGSRLSVSAE